MENISIFGLRETLKTRPTVFLILQMGLKTISTKFPINSILHLFQQGSLSRAFGFRPRSEKASPSSSSDTGSLASQYMSSARSNSPPPPQLPPRPITGNKRHRRVKSIGDIDYITSAAVSTPV